MRKVALFNFAAALLLSVPGAFAKSDFALPDARQAHVYRAAPGSTLAPAHGDNVATVAAFLAQFGRAERDLASLVTVSTGPLRRGIRHARFEQQVAGLRVYGAYARAAFDADGGLVHLIDGLAAVKPGGPAAAVVDEATALRAALRHVHPGLASKLRPGGRDGNMVTFTGGGALFARPPTVTRVAVPLAGGRLETGYVVETWIRKANLLHHTIVGGNGRILAVELRTANDSYNVFVPDPDKSPQRLVEGPGTGSAESPAGWLAGAQRTTSLGGNNVRTYLDADANDAPDPGGAVIANGRFLAVADLTAPPSTGANRAVAAQNLFYLANVAHDVLYRHGFDEAAGNFQNDNFGRGGRAGDAIVAEAQDGGGTDNANVATPSDGNPPRMQAYLWSPQGTHELVISLPNRIAGDYEAGRAEFGPVLDAPGVTGRVAQALDSRGVATDACHQLTNAAALAGRIALVTGGGCAFTKKVLAVQKAGAIAVIVVNDQPTGTFTMGGTDRRVTIPSLLVAIATGDLIADHLGPGVVATLRAVAPAPPLRDGAVDADVVFHEYGHGLTWRMIGGMSGVMSGAVGEGMSDVLAMLLNDDDRIAEYAFDRPSGVRTAPYTGFRRTYRSLTGARGVHYDGEVYAAIGWRLRERYRASGLTNDDLLGDLVGGMNFTPVRPAFEHMRDGILAHVAGTGRECLVWQGFAGYGVGIGARSTVRDDRVKVTESFAVPAACR